MLPVLLATLLSVASPNEAAVFVDKGDLFARAGTKQGIRVGMKLTLLGDKIGDTPERRTVGSAVVMEVWESLARLVPEEEGLKPQAVALPRKQPAEGGAALRDRGGTAPAASTGTGPGFKDFLSAHCQGVNVEV